MAKDHEGETYTQQVFREMYEAEIERRQKIRKEVAFPAGVLAILGGLIGFYAQQSPPTFFPWWPNGILAVCLILMCIAFGWTVYWLVAAYWPLLETAYTSGPSEIYDYIERLCEHYKGEGCTTSDVDDRVETDLKEFLSVQYIQCTERNVKTNDKRQKRLNFGSLGMMALIGILGVSFIPSYFAYHQRDTITNVRVVDDAKKSNDGSSDDKQASKAGTGSEVDGEGEAGAAADSNSEGR